MKNPEVPVFLLSKASGSVGLNLTVATHIMLLESDWNSLTEDQAISRAHRLGCTGPITVVRYICQSAHPRPVVHAVHYVALHIGRWHRRYRWPSSCDCLRKAACTLDREAAVFCIARASVIAASSSVVIG